MTMRTCDAIRCWPSGRPERSRRGGGQNGCARRAAALPRASRHGAGESGDAQPPGVGRAARGLLPQAARGAGRGGGGAFEAGRALPAARCTGAGARFRCDRRPAARPRGGPLVASALRRCPSGKCSALWLSRSARLHGYHVSYCCLPLFCFCGDVCLWAQLRTSDRDGSDGTLDALEKIVAAIRERFPHVQSIVRADSGFAREPIMAWCEAQRDVFSCIGLARNARLRVPRVCNPVRESPAPP